MGACISRDTSDTTILPGGGKPHAGRHDGDGGQRLGGSGSQDIPAAAAAAAAAEARAAKHSAMVGGASAADRRRREELVGRLQELYRRRGQEPPLGLPASSLKRLEELYADLRSPV